MVENSFVDPGWSEDRWAVTQSHQRHLAQVQYVDHIVGQVMARLEEAGIYDEAIVVVTADHGIGIRPGLGNRRRLVEGTIPDIAAVPLIVKAPGQIAGVVDDYPALVTDVVPTIAAMVGADLSWEAEGIAFERSGSPATPHPDLRPCQRKHHPGRLPEPVRGRHRPGQAPHQEVRAGRSLRARPAGSGVAPRQRGDLPRGRPRRRPVGRLRPQRRRLRERRRRRRRAPCGDQGSGCRARTPKQGRWWRWRSTARSPR